MLWIRADPPVTHDAARYTAKYESDGFEEQIRITYPTRPITRSDPHSRNDMWEFVAYRFQKVLFKKSRQRCVDTTETHEADKLIHARVLTLSPQKPTPTVMIHAHAYTGTDSKLAAVA